MLDTVASHLHSQTLHNMLHPLTSPGHKREPGLAHVRQLSHLDTAPPVGGVVDGFLLEFGLPPLSSQISFVLRVILVSLIHFVRFINVILGKHPGAGKSAKGILPLGGFKLPDLPFRWEAVFFSMIESCAIYLRRDADVRMAVLAARAGDAKGAKDHLVRSQKDINAVADALGCRFVQLCDFTKQSEGKHILSGAFCGAFVSKDIKKPFIGLAFKGDSNFFEAILHLVWHPAAAPAKLGASLGSQVLDSFRNGLFGGLKTVAGDALTAFDVLLEELSNIHLDGAKLHFTGHSLGGAYSALAYAEFFSRQGESMFAKFKLGNMYSAGAPEASLLPFADEVTKFIPAGGGKHLFRIVDETEAESAPAVPPLPFWVDVNKFPYVHLASG